LVVGIIALSIPVDEMEDRNRVVARLPIVNVRLVSLCAAETEYRNTSYIQNIT
jgi:hypothetical protein